MDPEWAAWKRQDDASAEVHPLDWQDELGPLNSIDDFDVFIYHMQKIERVEGDRAEEGRLCVELGYRDYWHYRRVHWTFRKYYSKASNPTSLRHQSWAEPDFSSAIMSSMSVAQRIEAERARSQNAHLFEPIDGVSLNRWAEIHTHKAHKENLPLPELLASFQLDVARWERIDAAWSERINQDVGGAMSLEFRIGQAEHSQGRYAASARAAAAAMRGDKSQLLGNEPMSQDAYTKLTLDMQRWAIQGLDPSAQAKETLGITQGDLQDLALYWNARWSAFGRELLAHAAEASAALKQMHEANVDLDADLQLGEVFSGAAAQPQPAHPRAPQGTILRCSSCGASQQQPGQFSCGFCGGAIVQA
jgi:hypothetical protein